MLLRFRLSLVMAFRHVILGSVVLSGSMLVPSAGLLHLGKVSDKVVAREIDLKLSDLPSAIKWTSSPTPPSTAGQVASGKRVINCITAAQHGAKVSTDPFGLTSRAGGEVTADVSSPNFSASSATQSPAVSSDVTFVTTPSEALEDQAAFSTETGLRCFAVGITAVASTAAEQKITAVGSFIPLARLGDGNGGVDARFTCTSSELPTIYIDARLYVEGRAEISIEYFSVRAPFRESWANSIASTVMRRATSLAK